MKKLKFIDLFAGIGGIRMGFENACSKSGIISECVFTSEIKEEAICTYKKNFRESIINGDITRINEKDIPDFDCLLAGFPCQAFSSAGSRRGFNDTRGTLFFDIERILKTKKPNIFLLENVEGLIGHDKLNRTDKIGQTLTIILNNLKDLGYEVSWKLIDSSDYGSAQKRKRVYIVGSLKGEISLNNFKKSSVNLIDVLEKEVSNKYYIKDELSKLILKKYKVKDLAGLQVRDKRGGEGNIHSWDIGLKGEINSNQKDLLENLLRQRRRKSWAKKKNIKWSDGMPLTLDDIMSFHVPNLFELNDKRFSKNAVYKDLEDLVKMGYLSKQTPLHSGNNIELLGYNIVVGKLSFSISKILDPYDVTPTLVATDAPRLAVGHKRSLRRLTLREGLRLFNFPEEFDFDDNIKYTKAFDLLGNSVCVNVIEMISMRMIENHF